jgi:hypothetical protein
MSFATCHAENARPIDARVTTIGQHFALEAPLLAALPADGFDIALTTTPRVDRDARITVRQALYSVPARLVGRTVRATLNAEELVVLHGSTEIARHPRGGLASAGAVVRRMPVQGRITHPVSRQRLRRPFGHERVPRLRPSYVERPLGVGRLPATTPTTTDRSRFVPCGRCRATEIDSSILDVPSG